jgi:hypothetical protein
MSLGNVCVASIWITGQAKAGRAEERHTQREEELQAEISQLEAQLRENWATTAAAVAGNQWADAAATSEGECERLREQLAQLQLQREQEQAQAKQQPGVDRSADGEDAGAAAGRVAALESEVGSLQKELDLLRAAQSEEADAAHVKSAIDTSNDGGTDGDKQGDDEEEERSGEVFKKELEAALSAQELVENGLRDQIAELQAAVAQAQATAQNQGHQEPATPTGGAAATRTSSSSSAAPSSPSRGSSATPEGNAALVADMRRRLHEANLQLSELQSACKNEVELREAAEAQVNETTTAVEQRCQDEIEKHAAKARKMTLVALVCATVALASSLGEVFPGDGVAGAGCGGADGAVAAESGF